MGRDGFEKQTVVEDALGLRPAAMFYMERLDETLDTFLATKCRTAAMGLRALGMMCDLMSCVVAMHRIGLRHNDLMFRNVMLRQCIRPVADCRRYLKLEHATHELSWLADSEYEVVVIDFGLASVSGQLASQLGDTVTHQKRDKAFGSRQQSMEVLYQRKHPLQCWQQARCRNLIDLHCMWHSIKNLSGKHVDQRFVRWCKQYCKKLCKVGRNAERAATQPNIEKVVEILLPQDVVQRVHV